jgi:hypothetical protein
MIGKLCIALLLTALFSVNAFAESTITCPSGYIDVVDWMTLDSDLRASKHMEQPVAGAHPMYTVLWPDKVHWIKTSDGTAWDINTFDNNYIYWWITDYGEWGHPRNYKMAKQGTNFKASPRCVPEVGYPSSVIINDNSDHDIYVDCVWQATANILKTGFSVWGPYYLSFGGDLPNNMPTYVISYSWNCNDAFTTCEKEVYYLSQRYGLVGYEYYHNVNGQEVLGQSTVWNLVRDGTAPVRFECF